MHLENVTLLFQTIVLSTFTFNVDMKSKRNVENATMILQASSQSVGARKGFQNNQISIGFISFLIIATCVSTNIQLIHS